MCEAARRLAALVAALALTMLAGGVARADDGAYRVNVTKLDASEFPNVLIVASVVDENGRAVAGLRAGDLGVFEEGAAQQATIALGSEVAPIDLVLVLDTSGSMSGRPLADAKNAIVSMIRSLGSADRGALVTFNQVVRLAQPLTSDKDALANATAGAVAAGDTAIYDALAAADDVLHRGAQPQARRAVILLTDGVDNKSRPSARGDALARVAKGGYPVYVIGLGKDLDLPALQAIADAGKGGQLFVAPTSQQLAAIYAGLSEQIRTEYTIRYRSSRAANESSSVRVQLRLQSGESVVGETKTSYTVPAGRGTSQVRATAAPREAPIASSPRASGQIDGGAVLVGVLGGATTLAILVWIVTLARESPNRQRRRVETFVKDQHGGPRAAKKRRPLLERALMPAMRTIGRPFMKVTPTGLLASTRMRLIHAGGPLSLGPAEFMGVRFGVAVTGAVVALGIVSLTAVDPTAFLFGGGIGVGLGFIVPAMILDGMAARRKRDILRALPASLDMLALSVEAGLAFDGAIAQVAQRWHTPLSEEFRRVLVEFQMGRDRKQALRELAAGTGVAEVGRFVNAVIQADAFGIPISKVLREQATEMRTRRRQRAEEMARQAPVKMLFPMILLLFPALFVVILGPAVPRILAVFDIVR